MYDFFFKPVSLNNIIWLFTFIFVTHFDSNNKRSTDSRNYFYIFLWQMHSWILHRGGWTWGLCLDSSNTYKYIEIVVSNFIQSMYMSKETWCKPHINSPWRILYRRVRQAAAHGDPLRPGKRFTNFYYIVYFLVKILL